MKECTSYFSLCCDKILDKKQFKRGRVGFGLQLGHAVLRGREGEELVTLCHQAGSME